MVKQEHQVQEYKPPKTSEETQFEQALMAPKIVNCPLEATKQALRYAFVMIGLRAENIPVEEEKAVLLEYIVENYGGHTAEEIKLAFKMAIQGKLSLKPNEIKCYENFSPLYFTTIMEAYREWSVEQARKLITVEKPKEPTERQKLNINIDYAHFLFKQINKWPVKL